MWLMTEHEKLVYLDADMIVVHNIDHLFDIEMDNTSSSKYGLFAAAPDCTYGRESQAERDACCLFEYNYNNHSDTGHEGQGKKKEDDETSNNNNKKKKLNQKPTIVVVSGDLCSHKNKYFNAGLFIMTPDISMFQHFHSILQSESQQPGTGIVLGFAEQDLLNYVYRSHMHWLDWGYNAQKGIRLHHPHLWRSQAHMKHAKTESTSSSNGTGIKVLHYTDKKPWNDRWCEENREAHKDICDFWWDIYEGKAPPYDPPCE